MEKEDPEWQENRRTLPRHDNRHYSDALEAAGISSFTLTRNDEGMWIVFRKE